MPDKYKIEKPFKYSSDGINVEDKKVGDPDFTPTDNTVRGLIAAGFISKVGDKKKSEKPNSDKPTLKMKGAAEENKAMNAPSENKAKS